MTHELLLWQSRFAEYLAVRGTSPRTLETYRTELIHFFAFLDEHGVQSLAELTRDHLEGYRTFLFYQRSRSGRNLALSTQQVRLQAIRRFAKFLAHERYHLLDVGIHIELPRRTQTLPRVILTESEIVRLMEAPDVTRPMGRRDRALLELLYGTGIRNSELIELRLEHLDLARRLVHIVQGKGRKDRVVPLGGEAQAWLEEYLTRARGQLLHRGEQPQVFVTYFGGPIAREQLAIIVARHGRRAGLDKHVTPHVLRHSCATHMLKRGAGLRHLQVMLGHSSADTTQRYTRVEPSDLRKVLRRCHPRERPE
jgi:integrase/recombinase XerD